MSKQIAAREITPDEQDVSQVCNFKNINKVVIISDDYDFEVDGEMQAFFNREISAKLKHETIFLLFQAHFPKRQFAISDIQELQKGETFYFIYECSDNYGVSDKDAIKIAKLKMGFGAYFDIDGDIYFIPEHNKCDSREADFTEDEHKLFALRGCKKILYLDNTEELV